MDSLAPLPSRSSSLHSPRHTSSRSVEDFRRQVQIDLSCLDSYDLFISSRLSPDSADFDAYLSPLRSHASSPPGSPAPSSSSVSYTLKTPLTDWAFDTDAEHSNPAPGAYNVRDWSTGSNYNFSHLRDQQYTDRDEDAATTIASSCYGGEDADYKDHGFDQPTTRHCSTAYFVYQGCGCKYTITHNASMDRVKHLSKPFGLASSESNFPFNPSPGYMPEHTYPIYPSYPGSRRNSAGDEHFYSTTASAEAFARGFGTTVAADHRIAGTCNTCTLMELGLPCKTRTRNPPGEAADYFTPRHHPSFLSSHHHNYNYDDRHQHHRHHTASQHHRHNPSASLVSAAINAPLPASAPWTRRPSCQSTQSTLPPSLTPSRTLSVGPASHGNRGSGSHGGGSSSNDDVDTANFDLLGPGVGEQRLRTLLEDEVWRNGLAERELFDELSQQDENEEERQEEREAAGRGGEGGDAGGVVRGRPMHSKACTGTVVALPPPLPPRGDRNGAEEVRTSPTRVCRLPQRDVWRANRDLANMVLEGETAALEEAEEEEEEEERQWQWQREDSSERRRQRRRERRRLERERNADEEVEDEGEVDEGDDDDDDDDDDSSYDADDELLLQPQPLRAACFALAVGPGDRGLYECQRWWQMQRAWEDAILGQQAAAQLWEYERELYPEMGWD